ncbi:hypothetical protein LTR37_015112 [Vermiconidia calcicola]|uniref:Uncharacterized protein n=1 Tax=Vermiconidia calcicola TaxID=1690605 RepID=A0ACC3MRS8_9PEZI|nr:hypothetical protein LTR37_015112 [Vermiconidia calcicola]
MAADFQGVPGFANGEYVFVCDESNNDCSDGGAAISVYKPTYDGNCYTQPSGSVQAAGDGVFGTACTLYSDDKCQTQVSSIGNTIGLSCGNTVGRSMKRFLRCQSESSGDLALCLSLPGRRIRGTSGRLSYEDLMFNPQFKDAR